MEYTEISAPPPLDAIVHCFWFLRGDSRSVVPQAIVADGRIEIVLHLADPFARIGAGGVAHRQATSLVAGQLTAPITVGATGVADVVGIRFRTAAASAVIRAPLGEFTDRAESLMDVAPSLTDSLLRAAGSHQDPYARAANLARALLRFVPSAPDPLATASARALDSAEATDLGNLARRFGVSTRTLERRVLAGTGLAPAALRRTLRFRRAVRRLGQSPSGRWARVASETGYFDQAHLIREFRAFTGTTPTVFFGREQELVRSIAGLDPQVRS